MISANKKSLKAGDLCKAPGTPAIGKVVGFPNGQVMVEYDHGDRKSHGVYEAGVLTEVEAPKPAKAK
jgi:hypothetical protein